MNKKKQKTIDNIMYQLGYLKLMELRDECGDASIDVNLPGLDGENDYLVIVKKNRAILSLVDGCTGEATIETIMEI